MNLEQEFDRQVQNLEQHNPLNVNIEQLRNKLKNREVPDRDINKGILPFVIVVKHAAMPGIVKLFPHTRNDFYPIHDVTVPDGDAYLLLDIDRGKETINIPPSEAIGRINEAGRSPLTIDEGIAILIHYPEFLMKNNCFSLLASRHPGNKRVPAIWINSVKQPNLGWCWESNPHTWLGSASCKTRIGN